MDAKIVLENYYKMLGNLIEAKNFAENSLTAYKAQLEKFHTGLNIVEIEDIASLSRGDFRNYVFGMEVSNDSKNAFLRVVRIYLTYLKNEQILKEENISNITFGNKKYFKSEHQKTNVLSDEEFLYIVKGCKNVRERFLVYFLRYTGLRESSVAEVKVKDISPDGLFHVSAKGGKVVPVRIPSDMLLLLDEYLRSRDSSREYLFYPTQGRGAKNEKIEGKTVYAIIKKILKRVPEISEERKAQITPHKFRHALVTQLYKENPTAANQAVHHASMATTNIYNDSPYAVGLLAVENIKIAR